eukprot:CAMPEP_0116011712 /NCGR_PEP_ID=MMETSP0321-20121206/4717_1 /TAXON_ID=163516 /ORGANISM="Leptocylindrus danicus var. danicus, Strain B650" /LENGTH=917 /DNA_ID=CAMNT_0003480969 /DNA_START=98 /DNA_END=2851 /DNA_ORIENTATION=-
MICTSQLRAVMAMAFGLVWNSSFVCVGSFQLLPSLHHTQCKHMQQHLQFARLADGSFDSDAPEPLESNIATAANDFLSENGEGRVELPDEISSSFMQYALSIILGRALPDARDGLKPVHRRILFAMHGLNLSPNGQHRKCARVVGEVLGKFHPHGDVAVYDALVRMAQSFSSNTPLIDGHGNFGSVDADPAAAMRYTECKLTKVAEDAMLADIDMDTVDFALNFDGNENEPAVLPAKVPMLLVNGGAGIAVGMATNVPPHNLGELMDACVALVESRDDGAKELSDKRLMSLVPGPDFPTGATIMGLAGAKKLYKTGNGGIIMRSKTHIENIKGKGKGRTAIIVTELPYQVNKAFLLEKIANLVNDKKIEGVADLRDESDRDGIRVVIELKRDAIPAIVQNNLFQKTPLQTSFSGNLLALMGSGTQPERFTLRSALDYFLDFRFETIRRRTSFKLKKVASRAHIVEGLLTALTSVDKVIDIIRAAPDLASAREILMDTTNSQFALSREQADSVLKLQLGQLTRLNKDKLNEELRDLEKSIAELNNLMSVDSAVREVMKAEFREMKEKYGVPRRTSIELDEGEISEIDLVRNSRSVIVITRNGYIKRMPLESFESQRRGTKGKKGTAGSNSSEVMHCFTCNDHDTILVTTLKGITYGIRAFQIPVGSRIAKGAPLPSVFPVASDDVIASVLSVSNFPDDEYVVLATEHGWIKKTPLAAFSSISSRGLTIASLEEGDRLRWCDKVTDDDDILIGTAHGKATRFSAEKLRPTGRTSRGVRSIKLRDGDKLADLSVLASSETSIKGSEFVLAITSHGYGKRVHAEEFRTQARGGMGTIAIKFKGKETNDTVQCLRVVNEDDEVLLITEKGLIVRQPVRAIPSQGKQATGVTVQNVDVGSGDMISSISIVPKYDESDNDTASE